MTPVNRRIVKVRQLTTETDQTLTYGKEILFQGAGDVVQIQGSDNQDGTQDVTYIIKPKIAEIKANDGTPIAPERTVNNKSQSQELFNLCASVAHDIGDDPSDLYKEAIDIAKDHVTQKRFDVMGY